MAEYCNGPPRANPAGNTPFILGAESFGKLDLPPPEFVLRPWLPVGGLGMIHSEPGLGKTRLALGISIAIATGTSLFGWAAPEARKVLYIDAEMATSQLQQWYLEARSGLATDKSGLLEANLRFLADGLQAEALPNLANVRAQEQFYNPQVAIYDVIIIDNLYSIAGDQGERWCESIRKWVLALRRQGKSLVLIAHDNKAKRYRGASQQITNLDTCIQLRRPKDYRPDDGCRFEVHWEKCRGAGPLGSFEARYIVNDGKSEWIARDIEGMPDVSMQILGLLQKRNEAMSPKDVAVALNLNSNTVRVTLTRMAAEGRLVQVMRGQYRVPPEPGNGATH